MTRGMQRLEALLVRAAGSDRPAVPEAGQLLWTCFVTLSNARQYDGYAGAQPIAFTEIEAWARVSRTPLRPDHIQILRRMDDAWLAAKAEARAEARGTEGSRIMPKSTDHAISPALFDVLF